MPMPEFDAETEVTLDQIARFLPEGDRAAAREAAVYATCKQSSMPTSR